VDLNKLAQEISALEGLKQPLSIAQIKEVLLCLGIVLARLGADSAILVVARIIHRGAVRLKRKKP